LLLTDTGNPPNWAFFNLDKQHKLNKKKEFCQSFFGAFDGKYLSAHILKYQTQLII